MKIISIDCGSINLGLCVFEYNIKKDFYYIEDV